MLTVNVLQIAEVNGVRVSMQSACRMAAAAAVNTSTFFQTRLQVRDE